MERKRWFFSVTVTTICIIAIVLTLLLNGHTHVARAVPFGITPTIPASPQSTVDFGSRQDQSHPIPGSIFGVNSVGLSNVINQGSPYLHQANFKTTRLFTTFPTIFPTAASLSDPTQQNWSVFDQEMARFQSEGLQPILSLDYSPTWMQPQNQNPPGVNYCLVSNDQRAHQFPSHVLPTYIVNGVDEGISTWAQLAALVVAHVDQNFPTIQPYYEIWNEPDGTHFLCTANDDPNPEQTQLNWYTSIYAATAPLLKQQGQTDNVQVTVGGPALAFPKQHATLWFPSLVNNPSIAPYIDFISYHQYFGNTKDTWDTGNATLLHAMQVLPMSIVRGEEYISSVVRNGQQPNAQATPIFIDEYGTFTGLYGCCQLSATYGPLWASLFVADILDTVLDTGSPYGPASAVPASLVYFSLDNPSGGLCLFGDTVMMNCSSKANVGPYPPYYTLQLLGDSNYLDITNGGYVASAESTNAPGIVVAGFYTTTKDNIMIVNTSAQDYMQFTIQAQNPGAVQPVANLYTLNQASPTIGTQQVILTPTGNGYQVTVEVPAYSTVALSLSL